MSGRRGLVASFLLPLLSAFVANGAEPITATVTLPDAAAAVAASEASEAASVADAPEGRRFVLGPIKRARVGATRWNVLRIVREIKETEGYPLDEDGNVDRSLLSMEVASRIQAENPQACTEVVGSGDEKDWQAFFDALIEFLERLMPLILQLIEIFGGLSAVFAKTGASLAGVFFLVRPLRRRAA